MKIIIASDIHGCVTYLKKLEKLINIEQPNYVILLGDLFNFKENNHDLLEFDQNKTAEILNKYQDKIIAVCGNCDTTKKNLAAFPLNKNYLTLNIDGHSFFLTHGHLISWYLDQIKDKLVLSGHTHVYNLSGKYINPGSVGLPRQNKEHTCIIYENKLLKLINLANFNTIQIRNLEEQ